MPGQRVREDRVPRRTSEIELWDVNPVGTREAWRREMLQFWSFMATRGKRVRPRKPLVVFDPSLQKNRYRTRSEIASLLATRIEGAPGAWVAHALHGEFVRWIEDAIVVPGERSGRRGPLPSAGLGVPHYAGLLLFNRSVTRERFWAAFMYSALASDFDAARVVPLEELAGPLLDQFLAVGLVRPPDAINALEWSEVNTDRISEKEPEVYLVVRGLTAPGSDQLGDASSGLGDDYAKSATDSALVETFLCPGAIVSLRRTLRLLIGEQKRLGHSALSELVEAALALHSALYFKRGMRVINQLSADRALPADCSRCWARYQADLAPRAEPSRDRRWGTEGYHGSATASEIEWVEANCQASDDMFVNAGPKELTAAKDLARISLEKLRRELASYTVNRISLSICRGVAAQLALQFREPLPPLDRVFERLDAWSADVARRGIVAFAWLRRIDQLRNEPELPGPFLETLDNRLGAISDDPRALEGVVREMVSETVLSSRTFGRYVELMHSLLGGGALPSNQDPKGLMARGGSQKMPFHLTINDQALELMVAVAVLEFRSRGQPLSFQDFVEFLATRFGVRVDQPGATESAPAGLVAAATMESRRALRERLATMGLLEEYSDSSEWNRITWVP
jgi:hypothetical protein